MSDKKYRIILRPVHWSNEWAYVAQLKVRYWWKDLPWYAWIIEQTEERSAEYIIEKHKKDIAHKKHRKEIDKKRLNKKTKIIKEY